MDPVRDVLAALLPDDPTKYDDDKEEEEQQEDLDDDDEAQGYLVGGTGSDGGGSTWARVTDLTTVRTGTAARIERFTNLQRSLVPTVGTTGPTRPN